MDQAGHTVTLYTAQTKAVVDALQQDGICFSKRKYIEKKYEESAPIFIAAYTWFAAEAAAYSLRPAGAAYPYWAFFNPRNVERQGDDRLLQMRVPVNEAVYFDLLEWNKILSLRYVGETPEEEARFRKTLAEYGVRQESDVMLTTFYPDLKREVQGSWEKLFRHHERIKNGDRSDVQCIQAALWCLKKVWIAAIG